MPDVGEGGRCLFRAQAVFCEDLGCDADIIASHSC